MKIVIFGLSISCSWGNGHATLWRALCSELIGAGHDIVFFERDLAFYRPYRDLTHLEGGRLVLYPDWATPCRTPGGSWPAPMRRSSPPTARTRFGRPRPCSRVPSRPAPSTTSIRR